MTAAKKLLNTQEAADYLGGIVSPRTLERWRNQERGPRITKMGARVCYAIEDLDEYRESCKQPLSKDFD